MDAEKIVQRNKELREAEWQKMVNGAVTASENFNDMPDDRAIIHAAQTIARLTAELADARNALDDAADEVADWGAYADEYFQQKHDLAGTVARLRALASGGTMVTEADRLRMELERSRRECEGLREALPRIAYSLRKSGASLPAPENKGTIESAMQTGLSIALCLVEDELAALSAGGSDGNAA